MSNKPFGDMDENELRLEVAYAKGYEWFDLDREPEHGEIKALRSKDYRKGESAWMFPNGGIVIGISLLDWTHSINDAWMLIQEIAGYGYFVRVQTPFALGRPYAVKVDCMGWGDENPPSPGGWSYGETAPIAICRAYLKWKHDEVKS